MIGIALAIMSAATSALSVVLVRRCSDQSNTFNISLIITLVGMLTLWPLAIVLTDFSGLNIMSIIIFAISGILTPGFVRLLYYQGMKKLGAPVNSSLFAVYPIYTAILAVLFLNEVLYPQNWVGILLVFLGGTLLELSSIETGIERKYTRAINLIFPIVGGLALGIGSLLRKFALDLFNAPVFGVAVAYLSSLLPFLFLLASQSTRQEISLKRDLRLFWVAGIGQAITWMLGFYALSYNEVSVITPLLSTEPIFVVLFSYLYLKKKDRITLKLVVSIIITVLGIVLVTAKM